MERFWSDNTSEAFAKLDHERLIAILPVGATEQHGPHLPLNVDTAIVNGVVEAVIERLPADSPALFLPTQAIGKSNEHSRYPGTLTFSAETLIRTWIEIGACVAASGVRKMVLLNGHGGQISTMDIVARELRVRHDMLVFSVNWFGLGMPDGLYDEQEMLTGIHAGDMETSIMLALAPQLVDMDKARDFRPLIDTFQRDYQHIGLNRGAKPGWQAQDMHPAGACGNATVATADKGQATIDFAADRIAEVLQEVDRAPLTWLDNRPEW